MKTSLNTNVSSLIGQRHLSKTKNKVSKTLGQLSSGKRITSAADDAASVSLSAKMNGTISSSKRALQNANEGINFVQVAEGSLNVIHENLSRMRELAIASANDVYDSNQKSLYDKEFRQLMSEIQRVSHETKFIDKKLINGNKQKIEIFVGTRNSSHSKITIDAKKYSATVEALGIFDASISTSMKSLKSLGKIDYAIDEISKTRAYYGGIQSSLTSASSNLSNTRMNISAAKSRIEDADIAQVTAEMAKEKIKESAATSTLAQANVKNKGVAEKLLD